MGTFPKGIKQPGVKIITRLYPVPSLGMSGAKQASNFTFSNSDEARGCKGLLTSEGPVVTIYIYIYDRRDYVDCSI